MRGGGVACTPREVTVPLTLAHNAVCGCLRHNATAVMKPCVTYIEKYLRQHLIPA